MKWKLRRRETAHEEERETQFSNGRKEAEKKKKWKD
jgi:hypothetical protein